MVSTTVKSDSFVCCKLVILTFLTKQREKIKSITNQSRQLKTRKCQGPRQEVHMQAASQLLIVLINKCREKERRLKQREGEHFSAKERNPTTWFF